jgi:hypothetical protein
MSDENQDIDDAPPAKRSIGLGWLLFRAPGRAILWWQYMFPGRGRVWVSARQRGEPALEVWYSLIFWGLIGAVIFVLVTRHSGP